MTARHWAGMLSVTVSDDGRGIDPERVRRKVIERGLVSAEVAAGLSESEIVDYIFTPGLSSLWVVLVSGVDRGIAVPLVHGLGAEMLVTEAPPPGLNDDPLGFDDAVREALA